MIDLVLHLGVDRDCAMRHRGLVLGYPTDMLVLMMYSALSVVGFSLSLSSCRSGPRSDARIGDGYYHGPAVAVVVVLAVVVGGTAKI
jgi:hypothetical protein